MSTVFEKPLSEVDAIFERCEKDAERARKEILHEFKKELNLSRDVLAKIPSLNVLPPGKLRNGSLVRFRCMIQDMYDPEYFIPTFESDDSKIQTSLFRDPLEGNFDEGLSKPMERESWHCIAIPAENEWVTEGFKKFSSVKTDQPDTEDESVPSKIAKLDIPDDPERQWCFPLETNRQSCIVKIYDETNSMHLNDTVEIVGILSHLPRRVCDKAVEVGLEEFDFKNPPTSVVPRIHAIFYEKISHQNPLLSYVPGDDTKIRQRMISEAAEWREELLSILRQVFFGDELCAEYLLMHLISRIYAHRDFMPLGNFSLNIQNVEEAHAKVIAEIIESLVPKSHYLPMSLDTLNMSKFVPSKDYELNRLQSGVLQLSEGTHLICDGTAMQAGTLQQTGLENVKALGDMIENQTLFYNFGFHPMEFRTDIPVLFLSEGKGILDCLFNVRMSKREILEADVESMRQTVKRCLTNEVLENLRSYLTIVRLADFEFGEDMQKVTQNDYVEERANNPDITPDHLHRMLILSRYASLTRGEAKLSVQTWNRVKTLETERFARLK